MVKKIYLPPEIHQQTIAEDISNAPPAQSSRSMALSNMKARLDMEDGDEHPKEHPSTIGPYKDMYLAIKELSCFPFGNAFFHGKATLIHNTQEGCQ
jgi:hypothetical protein